MGLYEIALTYDDREEVRLTDRRAKVGDILEIGGRTWEVRYERAPVDVRATGRFVCELTISQRERTLAMQAENSAMRVRLDALEGRRQGLASRPDAATDPDAETSE